MSTIAETTSGPVEGRVKDDALLFAGIPYAAPPTGEKRFMPAEPHPGSEAVRGATRFGPAAPQVPSGGMTDNAPVRWDEDCLTLNISTPALDDRGRPVLVWIHGGAYRTGQGAIPWYGGRNFAMNGDIVVVSINYRLGALGFADLSAYGEAFALSGVNGLLDQVTALEWVRDNIRNFGGDPGKVTIAGESAGGFAVSSLLSSTRAEGLFRRAIPQSGAGHHTLTPEAAARCGAALLAVTGAASPVELQQLPAQAILDAQLEIDKQVARGELDIGFRNTAFYPATGNAFLPVAPIDAIRAGQGSDVDVLIGSNKDETTLFVTGEVDEAGVAREADRYGGGEAMVAGYRAKYPEADPATLFMKMGTDYSFRIPAIRMAEARAATGGQTWMYRFDWESRAPGLKATHALEIPFAFDNLDKAGVDVFIGPGESPQGVADTMHAAWTRFIRGDDPGWDTYTPESRVSMRFDTESAQVTDPDDGLRQLWQGLR